MPSVAPNNGQALPTLVIHTNPKSPPAEAFRTLRTNLQFIGLDRPLGTLLITSPGPGEGKSTVAANLGVVLAQAGNQVILVGADLRKPSLHRIFGLSNDVGLTNVLTGHVSWQDALQPTGVEGVRVLLSGPIPPNPAELLGSERMRSLIQELREAADMVIFDVPPILSVTDAGILAQRVDGVLYLVSVGMTPRELVREGKRQLEAVGARIIGTVVNRIERSGSYKQYYYYYYSDEDVPDQTPWWRRLFNGWLGGGSGSPAAVSGSRRNGSGRRR